MPKSLVTWGDVASQGEGRRVTFSLTPHPHPHPHHTRTTPAPTSTSTHLAPLHEDVFPDAGELGRVEHGLKLRRDEASGVGEGEGVGVGVG